MLRLVRIETVVRNEFSNDLEEILKAFSLSSRRDNASILIFSFEVYPTA